MNKRPLLLPLLGLFGCTIQVVNGDHCENNDGDAYCAERFPERPFCNSGLRSDECSIEHLGEDVALIGCVAEEELRCHVPCGQNSSCEGHESSSSSGTDTSTDPSTATSTTIDTETETDTEEPSTTTGPACSGNEECLDPALPFCVEGECSPCSSVVETTPDEACVELDEAAPLCVGDTCVQCSAEDASACEGTTPLCDEETNTCVSCSFHEECQAIDLPACNIATGACFPADAVSMVNAGTSGALQAAVTAIPANSEHTIILTGSNTTSHTVTVNAGKTIAIVSTNTDEQELRGEGGNPTLTITGAGTTVYLHRLALTLNGDDVGVSVESSGTLYADSTRVAQNSGGGIELASGTSGFIRNSMVQGNATTAPAISATGATLDVLYSTLGLGFNPGDPVLECSGGSVSVRNSIIVSWTPSAGSEVSCGGIATVNSSLETTPDDPSSMFGGFASGNYSLTAAGQAQFADVAVWENGDPPFDFEGDARPSEDGASDFAGADTVP